MLIVDLLHNQWRLLRLLHWQKGGDMHRERLSNRRLCTTTEFEHSGTSFLLSIGHNTDKPLEIFLNNRHLGSGVDSIVRDAAIAISFALQYGAQPKDLASAMTRNPDGSPSSPVGHALDLMLKEET
jgi:hypothetical protein